MTRNATTLDLWRNVLGERQRDSLRWQLAELADVRVLSMEEIAAFDRSKQTESAPTELSSPPDESRS